MFSRLSSLARTNGIFKVNTFVNHNIKNGMGSKVGGHILPPEPHRTSFGLIRIALVVIPGLLIGAAISKSIANFLEENDLFVPSDDDDDDD